MGFFLPFLQRLRLLARNSVINSTIALQYVSFLHFSLFGNSVLGYVKA